LTKKVFRCVRRQNDEINFISGSKEAAFGLDRADGVVDLVETGTRMKVTQCSILTKKGFADVLLLNFT
jgi:ATP phosphoribosyltransferase